MRRHLDHLAATAARLAGGDDYELCFTAAPRRRAAIGRVAKHLGLALTPIGRIVSARRTGARVTVLDPGGRSLRLAARGFDHFG
jgi:thiamine-monophosphate kinase